MKKLYCLTFYDAPNRNTYEAFDIGLFAAYETALMVEARYRKEVPGFMDYNCKSDITEVPVIGDGENLRKVYRFFGWNEDAFLNVVDAVYSDCYASKKQAEADLERAKQETPRQEWALDRYTIDTCNWQEGFVRV